MKTIIVATDFSDNAAHAVGYAADFARSIRAKLVIFNAVAILPVLSEYPGPLEMYEEAIDASKDTLTRIKKEMEGRTDNTIKIQAVEKIGTFKNELEDLCDKEKPLAIFIASHLAGTLERILIGSHALRISRHNNFPVIIVPPMANFISFGKVAVALDMNEPGEFPFHLLKDWVQFFHSRLDIVYVMQKADISPNELPVVTGLQKTLSGIEPYFHMIENKDVSNGILAYVEEHKPDLLIVFPKKHTWFHKSESTSFIFQPPVPLMVLSRYTKEEAL